MATPGLAGDHGSKTNSGKIPNKQLLETQPSNFGGQNSRGRSNSLPEQNGQQISLVPTDTLVSDSRQSQPEDTQNLPRRRNSLPKRNNQQTSRAPTGTLALNIRAEQQMAKLPNKHGKIMSVREEFCKKKADKYA